MNESPRARRLRSNSTGRNPPFQFRATDFVKKVGALTVKLGVRKQKEKLVDIVQDSSSPYRHAQSMDVLRKPYMSQPVLTLSLPDDGDRSPSPGTSSNGRETPKYVGKLSMSVEEPVVAPARNSNSNNNALLELGKPDGDLTKSAYTVPLFAWERERRAAGDALLGGSAAGDTSRAEGVLVVEGGKQGRGVRESAFQSRSAAGQAGLLSTSANATASGGNLSNSSSSSSEHPPSGSSLLNSRLPDSTQYIQGAAGTAFGDTTRPSSSSSATKSSDTKMAVSSSPTPHLLPRPPLSTISTSTTVPLNADAIRRSQARTGSTSSKRPLPLRLASLPPLSTVHMVETADNRLRLSPSIIVRHPPYSILNLPALPPPTPVSETPRTPRPRLNTMPTLPLHGRDEDEEDDLGHEHVDMMNDEDDDEEGDEEEVDMMDGRGTPSGFVSSEDETVEDGGHVVSLSGLGSSNHAQQRLDGGGSGNMDKTGAQSNPSQQYVPSSSIASILELLDRTAAEKGGAAAARHSTGVSHAQVDSEGRASVSRSSSESGGSGSGSGSVLSGAGANDREEDCEDVATPTVHRSDYFSAPLSYVSNTNGKEDLASPATPTPTAKTAFGTISVPTRKDIGGEAGASSLSSYSSSMAMSIASTMRVAAAPAAGPRPTTVYAIDTSPRPRPGLCHQASKSMVDLSSTRLNKELMDRDYIYESVSAGKNRGSRAGVGGGVADLKGKGKSRESGIPSLRIGEEVVPTGVGDNRQVDETNTTKDGAAGAGTGDAQTHKRVSVISQKDSLVAVANAPPAPALRRRSSMPTFTTSGPPPPYPSFLPEHHLLRFKPTPRDEEGREQLPSYSNDIKLSAIMPRKMEFKSPGVHAKDRKWRRVQCVLEGTVFRVYRCPTKVAGVGVIGGWWERKVGVGDVALMGGVGGGTGGGGGGGNGLAGGGQVRVASPARRPPVKWEQEQLDEQRRAAGVDASGSTSASDAGEQQGEQVTVEVTVHPPPKAKRHLAATFLHPNRSRVSMDSASRCNSRNGSRNASKNVSPASSPIGTPRSSLQINRPSSDSSASASASGYTSSSSTAASSSTYVATRPSSSGHSHSHSSSSSSRNRSHFRTHSRTNSDTGPPAPPPEPNPKDLLREYTLQNAESGLASDYFKRKNVIRVRMEGEQFLLQATNIAGVIEWIEGLQAATNIALDLDERLMPKGPIFPRRRRRRRPRVTAEDPQIGVQITDPS